MEPLKQSQGPPATAPGLPMGFACRDLWQDVRYAARVFSKQPAFAAAAVLTLALGIGATAAIFSVVYGVLLKPLPFQEPERLVSLWLQRGLARNYPAAADAHDLRELRNVFADVAFFENSNLNLVGDGEPQ